MRVNILYNKKGSIDEIYTPPHKLRKTKTWQIYTFKLKNNNFYYILDEYKNKKRQRGKKI